MDTREAECATSCSLQRMSSAGGGRLVRRGTASHLPEERCASPADVDSSWYGLSPTLERDRRAGGIHGPQGGDGPLSGLARLRVEARRWAELSARIGCPRPVSVRPLIIWSRLVRTWVFICATMFYPLVLAVSIGSGAPPRWASSSGRNSGSVRKTGQVRRGVGVPGISSGSSRISKLLSHRCTPAAVAVVGRGLEAAGGGGGGGEQVRVPSGQRCRIRACWVWINRDGGLAAHLVVAVTQVGRVLAVARHAVEGQQARRSLPRAIGALD